MRPTASLICCFVRPKCSTIAEIRTEVKIQFKEVFARVKRLEAIMIGASASIIAMLVVVLTRMP
jgi:hypothetical protein